MRSRFFENALAEVMNLCGEYSELSMRRALANSCMLSSDVSAAYDPYYGSVFEKKNTSFLGRGAEENRVQTMQMLNISRIFEEYLKRRTCAHRLRN